MSMGLSETKATSETQVDETRDGGVMSSVAVIRRKSKRDYPKYTIRSDVLIKTGLSRDRRNLDEHSVRTGASWCRRWLLFCLSARQFMNVRRLMTSPRKRLPHIPRILRHISIDVKFPMSRLSFSR